MVTYWNSMWSHRRDETWKRFIQISLSIEDDEAVTKLLVELEQEGAIL
jgi:hypothetical protein